MSSHTVLLVEDSEFITEHVSETLHDEHGFDVRTAKSADETRATLEDDEIECVISSYELPDETGIELAASINGAGDSDGTQTPFILFTGNPLEPLAEDALEAGIAAFVSKSNRASGTMDVFANRIELVIRAYDSSTDT